MQDNQKNWNSSDSRRQEENQNRNRQNSPTPRWDLDNHFHTGPNQQSRSHFPEDSHQRSSNADLGGSREKHYGERDNSVYRNNNLNYGENRDNSPRQTDHRSSGAPFSGQQRNSYSASGDGRGNYSARQDSYGHTNDRIRPESVPLQRRQDDSNENYYRGAYMDERGVKMERPRPDENPYREHPGSRSRYKDDDYRYGSGNHTTSQERRYTDSRGNRQDRNQGDILNEMGDGLRDAWHDIKDGVQNTFNRFSNDNQDRDQRNNYQERTRRNQYNERSNRRPNDADAADDSFFYSDSRNPRYY